MEDRFLRLKTQFITREITLLKFSAVLTILLSICFFVLGNTLAELVTDDTVTFSEAIFYSLRTFASFVILGTVINTLISIVELIRSQES